MFYLLLAGLLLFDVALFTFAQHSALASLGNDIFDCGVHLSCAQQCR
jgi:hypothetical protein